MFRNENFKFIVPISQNQFSMQTMFQDFLPIWCNPHYQSQNILLKSGYLFFSNLGCDVPFKFGLHLICLCTISDPNFTIRLFLGVRINKFYLIKKKKREKFEKVLTFISSITHNLTCNMVCLKTYKGWIIKKTLT
jgi:hypothetical protein